MRQIRILKWLYYSAPKSQLGCHDQITVAKDFKKSQVTKYGCSVTEHNRTSTVHPWTDRAKNFVKQNGPGLKFGGPGRAL